MIGFHPKKLKNKKSVYLSNIAIGYVGLIIEMSLETENTSNMFSVFISHHSKIKELSDGNKNWKQIQTEFFFFFFPGTYIFWVMSDGNKVMSYGNGKSKQIFKYFMSTPSPQTYLIYKPFFLRTFMSTPSPQRT